ncbi:MAG: AAA family ATPase [Acidimicrobiales bacterium]
MVIDVGDDETYVLTRIGTHDEIDRWMMQNISRVNEVTGALEIVNIVALEEAVEDTQHNAGDAAGAKPLFEHRTEKEFRQLGVDVDLLPVLRLITSEEQLEALLKPLPQNQAEALICLTGDEPVDVLFGQIAGDIEPGSVDTEDLAAALAAPASRNQFHVLTSEGELADVLALPLAQWRTYLHTSQHQLAYRPVYNGPVRVTGGAGTGKTVVAMHRAKHLADAMPADAAGQQILFTTFTRNLAQVIERDLRLLGGGDLLERVEVLNVDRLAYRVVQEAEGAQPRVVDGGTLNDHWQDVIDEHGIELTREFLNSEWEQVILAQGCTSRSDYFNAPRSGRGLRLDRRGRADVWKAVELLTQRLSQRNERTYLQLAQAAAGYLKVRPVKPYRHIVVDEAQDLHEQQWRLLREMCRRRQRSVHRGRQPPAHLRPQVVTVEGGHQHPGAIAPAAHQLPDHARDPRLGVDDAGRR